MILHPPPVDVLRRIWEISCEFQRKCERNNVANTWKDSNKESRVINIRKRWFGFVGSRMLSEYLELPWHEGEAGFENRHKHGDVGDYDCRTRTKTWHGLSVRTNDTRIQILLKPMIDWFPASAQWKLYPELELCGWHFPWYVRKPEWASRQKGVYFLPDEELIHINNLQHRDFWFDYFRYNR